MLSIFVYNFAQTLELAQYVIIESRDGDGPTFMEKYAIGIYQSVSANHTKKRSLPCHTLQPTDLYILANNDFCKK